MTSVLYFYYFSSLIAFERKIRGKTNAIISRANLAIQSFSSVIYLVQVITVDKTAWTVQSTIS